MDKHIINEKSTVREALGKLNSLSGGEMTLVVVDDSGKMKGSLTDGDIRRGLLGGYELDDIVSGIMFRDFHALRGDDDDISRLKEMRNKGLTLIPLLDDEGKIEKLIDTTKTHSVLPLSAILMAGGKGERLRPLTLTVPKPLLEVGGKAIIDYNIELLEKNGISDIVVTVNYMADSIEKHFSLKAPNVRIIKENNSLGTIGAASLLKHTSGRATVVMNADLLTTVSLEDMYIRHQKEKADITIATIAYNLSVPYAILTTDGTSVTGISEKPSYSYYANAGIYIFSNEILNNLEPGVKIDATDLIEKALTEGKKVTYYPISGTWIDIGTPVDYQHACELMQHHENLNR